MTSYIIHIPWLQPERCVVQPRDLTALGRPQHSGFTTDVTGTRVCYVYVCLYRGKTWSEPIKEDKQWSEADSGPRGVHLRSSRNEVVDLVVR